jgi:membrane protein YdbS with pleckstrin-like domain
MIFKKNAELDERFVMHRLYATRFAALVTAVFVGAWFFYELLVNDVIRQDFVIILVVMAVAKLLAMLYYRFTD